LPVKGKKFSDLVDLINMTHSRLGKNHQGDQKIKMAPILLFGFFFVSVLGQDFTCPANCYICQKNMVTCVVQECFDPIFGKEVPKLEVFGFLCPNQRKFLEEGAEFGSILLHNDECMNIRDCR